MKITFNILIFIFSGIIFGQNSDINNSNAADFLSSAECLSTTMFVGDDENLMVILLNEQTTTSDTNSEHYYIQSSREKNIEFINLLSDNQLLREVFIIDYQGNNGYKELETDKIVDGKDVELFIQIDFGSPCHNDTLFILIKDTKKAEKITLEMAELFNSNKGFKKLTERIKT